MILLQQKPCIATYFDGFSYCLELICLFLSSIPSIFYDIKTQDTIFNRLKLI